MPFNASVPLQGQSLRLPDLLGQFGQMQNMLAQQQQMQMNAEHGQLYAAQARRAMQQAAKEEAAQAAQQRIVEQLAIERPEFAALLRLDPKAAMSRIFPEPAKQTMPAGFEMGPDGKWQVNPAVAEHQAGERRAKAEEQMQQWREKFAEQTQARQDMLRLAASMRAPAQPPAPSLATIADPNDPTKSIVIDARTDRVIGSAPQKAEAPAKALPVSAAQKLFENQQNLRRAEQGLSLIKGEDVGEDKGSATATGWKGFLPEAVLQRTDPGGVSTRAAIADLGSLIIHDRSGAAVTAAEMPRLKPFIPSVTDDPETVKKKLTRFVGEYRKIAQETSDFYKESGYKVPTETLQGSGATKQPTGAKFLGFE